VVHEKAIEISMLNASTERSALNAENWTLDQWSGRVLLMNTREYILFGILQHLYIQTEKATSAVDLATTLAVSEGAVLNALSHLAGKGLLDGTRLTMRGLAAASALCAARRSRSCAA
jgi:hypothetical protein